MKRTFGLATARRVAVIAGVCLLTVSFGQAETETPKSSLLGCWRSADGVLVRFEAERVTVCDRQKRLRFYYAKYKDGGSSQQAMSIDLRSPLGDAKGVLRPQIQGGVLTIDQNEVLPKSSLRKLTSAPPELELQPLQLGNAKPLPRGKVRTIKKELARRAEADQAVRGDDLRNDPAKRATAVQTDRDNIAYLIQLIQELGWIDAKRFGGAASANAALIVQHSANLPLMAAALPEIEKDIEAKRFSILGMGLYPLMVYRFQALQAKPMGPKELNRLKELGFR